VRRSRCAIAAMIVAGLLGLAVGCGGDDDEAQTTTEAPAATTAPPATEPAPTTEATTEEAPTTEAEGDVAAGQTFFASTCQSCHLNGGRDAGGVGPQLAGMGLSEDRIREQIVNGGGGMPAGLASGEDLENVTAYVLSLQ